jgi:phospholipase C
MKSDLDKFDHVVVLMLENRSFDNLLGYLYEPGQVPRAQPFEGVAGKALSNPIPPDADQAHHGVVPITKGYIMDNPNPDPGEEYPHVNTQLYGAVIPEANRYKQALHMAAPFNLPDPVPFPAPMNGFLTDYIDTFRLTEGRAPSYDEYKVIMNCYAPDAVPVISTLARQFAVCDHWHCAVPSQTFCNRSFFHAASSSGVVVNLPFAHWIEENRAETIFNRIEASDQDISWKIYFDQNNAFSLTGLIHYARLRDYFDTHFFPMEQFYEDVRTGDLPNYAFIEPRLFINHNDMHPPIRILGKTQPSSVLAGELLIYQVYEAIRRSDSATGSNYQNTLLVITFDEHGGCYDHVSPPAATPPDPTAPDGQMDFKFDRLGVRVPTVLISAYIEPGTVISAPLQHASILKTLAEKWGLGYLTERDKSATGIREAFSRSQPRDRKDWPEITPRKTSDERASNLDHPLNKLQKDILGLAIAIGGDPEASLSDIKTVFEAEQFMKRKLGQLKE